MKQPLLASVITSTVFFCVTGWAYADSTLTCTVLGAQDATLSAEIMIQNSKVNLFIPMGETSGITKKGKCSAGSISGTEGTFYETVCNVPVDGFFSYFIGVKPINRAGHTSADVKIGSIYGMKDDVSLSCQLTN